MREDMFPATDVLRPVERSVYGVWPDVRPHRDITRACHRTRSP